MDLISEPKMKKSSTTVKKKGITGFGIMIVVQPPSNIFLRHAAIIAAAICLQACSGYHAWKTPAPDFMVIAHRGASGSAPENTLAAVQKAIQAGAGFIEVDVHQSRDGIPVVIHDYTLDRTTNGSGEVSEFTFDELQQLDAGSWYGPAFSGEKIPSLEQVLSVIPDEVTLSIEIKGDSCDYPGLQKNVLDVILKLNRQTGCIIKSFDEQMLVYFKREAPSIPRILVYVFGFGVLDADVQYLQHYEMFLSRAFVARAQSLGYRVIAWGVQSEYKMREMLYWGVNGIETDYPQLLLELIQNVPD